MGSPFAGVLDAVQPGTGHVLAMSVEPPVTAATAPDCDVGQLQRRAAGRHRVDLQGVHRRRRAVAGLRRALHDHRPAALHLARSTRARDDGQFGPLVVYNDDPDYKATYDMTSALVASANTYYVGLEDALGSIDARSCRRPRPWACTSTTRTDPAPGRRRSSRTSSGTFTLGRTRPARWTWPTPTPPSPRAARTATPTPVTAVLDQNGQPLKDDKGKVDRHRRPLHAERDRARASRTRWPT